MGATHGKQSSPKSLSFLQDFSDSSGLSMVDITRHYEDWIEKNPKGMMGKTSFIENLGKVNPTFSKADVSKIGEHAFRVFDTDHDGKINFLEFMVVYNIMAWTDPQTILIKMFDIFDVDEDNMITKSEMKSVVTDLAVLFKDPTNGKNCVERTLLRG